MHTTLLERGVFVLLVAASALAGFGPGLADPAYREATADAVLRAQRKEVTPEAVQHGARAILWTARLLVPVGAAMFAAGVIMVVLGLTGH
jgi:hypothetical protein